MGKAPKFEIVFPQDKSTAVDLWKNDDRDCKATGHVPVTRFM
jgi:hypothetical protein